MSFRSSDVVAPVLAEVLRLNGISGFEDLWGLPHRWVQPPNERRGGRSGVARYEWERPGGGTLAAYLKVHENRVSRSLLHPLGIPTLRREFNTMRAMAALGMPVLEPILFAQRTGSGPARALLATEEAVGFRDLKALAREWRDAGWPPPSHRRPILEGLASLLATGHRHRWKFNAFTAEHALLRDGEGGPEFLLIDLERCKRVPFRVLARVSDLATLHRTTPHWARTDRMRFLRAYLGTGASRARVHATWRGVVERRRRQEERRAARKGGGG